MNAEILRWILLTFMGGMVALALAYLVRRKLTFHEIFIWGMITVCLPIFGPFITIAARPGTRGRERIAWIRRKRRDNTR